MYSKFPLFQSHLDLAHAYWAKIVKPSDIVIDATCGNGHDALALAKLSPGTLFALDIQNQAIQLATQLLKENLSKEHFASVNFIEGCHSTFPTDIKENSVKLIVYNLGYLPKGNKEKTTLTETTIKSLQNVLQLIADGGLISITCYPGHPEGQKEEQAILEFCSALDPKTWSCCHHRWLNRDKSPSLLLIQKS